MDAKGKALPEKEKGHPLSVFEVSMRPLFKRKQKATTVAPPSPVDSPKGLLLRPESASALLSTPRRQKLLEHIWQRTSLSRQQFHRLYLTPLQRYAELVQQFPASESHHHAYPGGMLDHGLEVVAYALKLRQSYLLPAGATPEAQAAQSEAWTTAVAYAALLHDLGKIAVDLQVEYADGAAWHPWHGPLKKPYRFRYRKAREYRLHNAATGLLYARLLDDDILDWLSDYPDLWAALLYVLAGQYEHAGTLGELVVQADQASVAQQLGGDPSKALAAPPHALQRKLLDGLRYLLKEEFKLNQPQASDGWLTKDALWLVSKTVSDKLRAHLLSQGIEGIPTSNTAVFNVLQDHGIALATADGKAIWKATIMSDTGWSHSFTFLKVAPAMIWETAERPVPFAGRVDVGQDDPSAAEGIPQNPRSDAELPTAISVPSASASPAPDPCVTALLDLLDLPTAVPTEVPLPALPTQTASLIDPSAAPTDHSSPVEAMTFSGAHFMSWLAQAVQSHKLIINDAKALVHTVGRTAYLVSPGVFQRYVREYPAVTALAKEEKQEGWRWVQKRFEKLALHRKEPNGLNIWTCEVIGPRKSRRLHGYLLQNPEAVFSATPPDNPYLRLISPGQLNNSEPLPGTSNDQR